MGNILMGCEEWSSGPTCLLPDHLLVLSNLGGGGRGGRWENNDIYLSEIQFSQL